MGGSPAPQITPPPVKIDTKAAEVKAADARRRNPGVTRASTMLVSQNTNSAAKQLTGH